MNKERGEQVWVHEEGGGGEWGTTESWDDGQGIGLKGTEEAFTLAEEVCTHPSATVMRRHCRAVASAAPHSVVPYCPVLCAELPRSAARNVICSMWQMQL